MDDLQNIAIEVATLKGQIDTIIAIQKSESEARKLDSDYLRQEVHRALNSHADIKRRLSIVEQKEFSCPILDVQSDVKILKSETEESRAKYKFPELREGVRTWERVKTISAILGGIVGGASFIFVLMRIFKIV